MIGKLRGIIDKIMEGQLILDVNGVGYLVACSNNTISRLGGTGTEASLLIETVVREDAINLFGFATEEEKQWFNLLTQKVSGVGAKMAISILSSLGTKELALAIAAKDKTALKQANGVGTKLAERIVVELADVAGKMGTDNVINIRQKGGSDTAAPAENNYIMDASLALEKLGFGRSETYSILNKIVLENSEIGLESLIKEGLKKLASGR